ncbi:MAG: hypothetical protein JWN86_649 [Planctomycetota bacterium]|nr:hypothetical protein [Planctomycetota bacterium]
MELAIVASMVVVLAVLLVGYSLALAREDDGEP